VSPYQIWVRHNGCYIAFERLDHARRPAQAGSPHAIVVALCAGEPAPGTAAALGVSIHYYYRERHAICTRVSRALMQPVPDRAGAFKMLDPLRLLFARAEMLLGQGFAGKAVSMLAEARSGMPEGAARSAVRLELARALIRAR
jgi:hypothetical protein